MPLWPWSKKTDMPEGRDEPIPVQEQQDVEADAAPGVPDAVSAGEPSSGHAARASHTVGLRDAPITTPTEAQGLSAETEGLLDFLTQCPTPLTVAIQGEWGAGKTSLLNLVGERLEKDGRVGQVVRYNAWEMAFIDPGPLLTLALMERILDSVGSNDVRTREILSTLGKVALLKSAQLAPLFADAVGPIPLLKPAAEAISKVATDRLQAPEPSLAQRVLELRTSFQEQVESYLEERREQLPEADRIIVLIDDLDRLPPRHAVELLESLKSLMDSDGCVFVVAVDFEVVRNGVKGKYPGMTDGKARAFFDKLVQVPFQMPRGEKVASALLTDALGADRIPAEDRDFLTQVLQLATNNNPRAVKRVLNSFILMRLVEERRTGEESQAATDEPATIGRAMFCMQALQVAFPDAAEQVLHAPGATRVADAALDLASQVDQQKQEEDEDGGADRLLELLRLLYDATKDSSSDEKLRSAVSLTRVSAPRVAASPIQGERLPLEERIASAAERGTDPTLVSLAERLEKEVEAELHTRGCALQVIEKPGGRQWSWQSIDSAGRVQPLGGPYFARRGEGAVNLVVNVRNLGDAGAAAQLDRGRTLARRWGLSLNEPKSGGYFTIKGLPASVSDADVHDIASLVARTGLPPAGA